MPVASSLRTRLSVARADRWMASESAWIVVRPSRWSISSSVRSARSSSIQVAVGLQRLERGQPAHQLLYQVGLHVPVQQVFLGLLGQHRRLVETDVALLQQFGLGYQFLALRRAQLELEAGAQLEFTHLADRKS